MFKVLSFLCLLITYRKFTSGFGGGGKSMSFEDPRAACHPYPANLSSLEDCCSHPVLFNDDLLGTCEFLCEDEKESEHDPDCPYKCLLKNNGIVKNGTVNETAMEWTLDKFGLANPDWKAITKEALELCKLFYNESDSVKEDFEAFERCMNEHYQGRCIEFNEPKECEAVEAFMLKCQNIKHDCNTWPKWIVKLPETCCPNRPELFNADFKGQADKYCGKQDIISNAGQMQCRATFLLNSTGVKSSGKYDFAVIKKLLTENSNKNAKWTAGIEKTVHKCEQQVNGLITSLTFCFISMTKLSFFQMI